MDLSRHLSRALILAVLPFTGGAGAGDAAPVAGDPVPVPSAPAPEDSSEAAEALVEHFLVEWTDADVALPAAEGPGTHQARKDRVVALVRLRRGRVNGDLQLEMDYDDLLEGVRLSSHERLGADVSRLIWRERTPGRGRTLRAEWSPDGSALETAEWDVGGRRARRASLEEGGVLPQYLVDLARTGRVVSGRFRVFDPLAARLEVRELSTCYESDPDGWMRRVVRLRRADGTLAGEYCFDGRRLVSFRLQDGRIAARAVDRESWEAARDEFRAGPAAGAGESDRPAGS